MFNSKKKVLALTISAIILFLSFGTTGYAATVQSTLKAQFKALKILLNGSQVTMESQPIIVNGTTYLPLRAFANLFQKNVDWNATLQQVSITDQANNEVASLKAQITEKDNQILLLQTQLAAKSTTVSTLSDMEDQLNEDYEDYEDLSVDITLSGTKTKMTLKVDIGDKADWNDLSSTKQTKLLQNIVDDINEEFDDPSISGTVKDGSTTINSFSVNSSGTVKMGSSGDLGDLEDDLNSDYDNLEDIDEVNIVLDGDEDEITFTVEIAYDDFDSEWDDLTDSKIENYMEDIKEAIEDAVDDTDYDLEDYEDAEVKGYIVNTDDGDDKMATLADSGSFSRDSSYPKK